MESQTTSSCPENMYAPERNLPINTNTLQSTQQTKVFSNTFRQEKDHEKNGHGLRHGLHSFFDLFSA